MRKLLGLVVAVAVGVVAFVALGGDTGSVRRAVAGVLASDAKFEAYFSGDPGTRVQIDERASIEFPAAPERSTPLVGIDGMPDVEMTFLEVTGKTRAYAAGYADIPGLSSLDEAQRKEVLEAAARGGAGGLGGELTTWLRRPFRDRDAIEYTVREDGDVYVKGEVLIDGDRVYILFSADDRNPPRAFERFLHSLEFSGSDVPPPD